MTRRSKETDLFRVEIECDRKGRKLSEVWLQVGHRYQNGDKSWLSKPLKGREGHDHPAVQKWDPKTGVLIYEAYYSCHAPFSSLDREGGPALIRRHRVTGAVIQEEWYSSGERHREGGRPAVVSRDPHTGVITNEEYWYGDDLHRDNGKPAIIKRNRKTGEITQTQYFLIGRRVSGREAAHQAEYRRKPAGKSTSRLKPNP